MSSARAAVVTVSDGVSAGTRVDESGQAAAEILSASGYEVATTEVVPDDRVRIEELLRSLASEHSLIVTTGGTGFGPRDVTPEATRAVIDREAPGLTELMRRVGLEKTPMAALSRAVAGSVGSTLILNLPGSPRGVRESLEAVAEVLPHAVELLAGSTGAHPTGHGRSGAEAGGRPAEDETAVTSWVEVKAVKVVQGTPPCEIGMSLMVEPGGPVHGTLGCAEFDTQGRQAALAAFEAGEPTTAVLHHDLGDVEVFVEPHRAPPRLVVVSATDVARRLRGLLRTAGYHVVLVEPRAERVVSDDEPSVRALDDLILTPDDVVVLTDHDAPGVTETIAVALRSPARFVGVMGSRRHVGHYVEELRSRGFGEDELARIRSPLGLDLGGKTPDTIALSIAAGIVADRNDRDGGWLDR
jgi:molybdenum cofactor synthesis domain-containing protein